MDSLKLYASFTPMGCAIIYACSVENPPEIMKVLVPGLFILGVLLCMLSDLAHSIVCLALVLLVAILWATGLTPVICEGIINFIDNMVLDLSTMGA